MPHPAPAHKSFTDRNSLYQEIIRTVRETGAAMTVNDPHPDIGETVAATAIRTGTNCGS
jgi:hypothetical protein